MVDITVLSANAALYIRNNGNTGDFSQWGDEVAYQKAFERLLRDLKVEELK
jgi:hypothetical protein